jgi:hypothetical protein
LSKRFYLSEHKNIEILAEGFNIFNRSNVAGTNAVNSSYISTVSYTATGGTLFYNPSYGTVNAINNSTVYAPRQIQIGARFNF